MLANAISFAILFVFLYGRGLAKKNLKWHIRLMLFCWISDLALVLALVAVRRALHTVAEGVGGSEMHWSLMIHVPIAVATLAFYFCATYFGWRLYKGDERARRGLIWSDRFLLPLRILTSLTSVMVSAMLA